jgi:hypothetical protein
VNWIKNRSWRKVATVVLLSLGLYQGTHWFVSVPRLKVDVVILVVCVLVAVLIDARKGRKFRKDLPPTEHM